MTPKSLCLCGLYLLIDPVVSNIWDSPPRSLSPSIHALVYSPPTLNQGWSVWQIENGRSDAVWFQRPGHKRDHWFLVGLFYSLRRKPVPVFWVLGTGLNGKEPRSHVKSQQQLARLVSKLPWRQILQPPVKPSEDYNLMGDHEPELCSQATPEFLNHSNHER